jgi:hypothetical protein
MAPFLLMKLNCFTASSMDMPRIILAMYHIFHGLYLIFVFMWQTYCEKFSTRIRFPVLRIGNRECNHVLLDVFLRRAAEVRRPCHCVSATVSVPFPVDPPPSHKT